MDAKTRKRIGLIALAVVLVLVIAYGFWPKPELVEVVEATRGPLEVTLEEEGQTRVKDRFVITAPVASYAQRVNLEVGDAVEKGETLLTLEPMRSDVLDPRRRAEATARVQAAQAALRAAEENARAATTDAELAAAERARIQKLYEVGSATQQTLDQAEAAARRAQAAQQSAEAAVEVARYDLAAGRTALDYSGARSSAGHVQVEAPVAGHVLRIHHQSEGVVGAGEPLLELGDPRALEVAIDVLSADAVDIEPGTHVRFDRWGGEEVLEGVVRVVEPTAFTKISALGVEEQRVIVIADFVSPAAEWTRLGDGYRVIAHFILWEGEDALQIPTSALFRHGNGWAVFVMEDGEARRRPVEVGHRNGLTAQIADGLTEGEAVIVHPSDEIEDGGQVEPR
ncbi:MAG TPA: efflux RND transporter periplasmic adaptor subunit [Rhodothermales bacterium]|nr:efflux RND transporter periplasmic adaptor subunit [Rhodothermales bacterium]